MDPTLSSLGEIRHALEKRYGRLNKQQQQQQPQHDATVMTMMLMRQQREMEKLLDDLESATVEACQWNRKRKEPDYFQVVDDMGNDSESYWNDPPVVDLRCLVQQKFALLDPSSSGRMEVSRLLTSLQSNLDEAVLRERDKSEMRQAATTTTTRQKQRQLRKLNLSNDQYRGQESRIEQQRDPGRMPSTNKKSNPPRRCEPRFSLQHYEDDDDDASKIPIANNARVRPAINSFHIQGGEMKSPMCPLGNGDSSGTKGQKKSARAHDNTDGNCPISNETDLATFLSLQNKVLAIEKEKSDKTALLQAWRELDFLVNSRPNTKTCMAGSDSWVQRRRNTLKKVARCIQTCWQGNEAAYCASQEWPNLDKNYRCSCPGRRLKRAQLTAGLGGGGQGKGDDNIDVLFRKLREKYTLIEQKKRNKGLILQAWRELKTIHQQHAETIDNDPFMRSWFGNRIRHVQGIENCIQTCWGGKEAVYCKSLVEISGIVLPYKCTCKAIGTVHFVTDKAATAPDQHALHHAHQLTPSAKPLSNTSSGDDKVRIQHDFDEIKTRIEAIEKYKIDKLGLFRSYGIVRRDFIGKEARLCLSSQQWIKNRMYTLQKVENCIQGCFRGDKEAYLSLSSWPEMGRSCKCRCRDLLLKRPRAQEQKISDSSDNDAHQRPSPSGLRSRHVHAAP